ncbi:hypothetical protein FisN_7Lh047 [Fistulifera solaris]|uniref:Glycoside hydrolase family 5 domain-containing protein n=1 Tax=Fistulifera solaris TaxID=1519565 RepID=A0A1Z5JCH3_FISSO|nr:hypothetical protein FisN_7Lh047 [Fistulifera solaris]|eukprot:GAX11679.1 hypothetical protein FisN_7Lh047 [Fistulifera solaris]
MGNRLPPLEFLGNQFFNSETGESVRLKGVAYYPRPNAGTLNVNGLDFFHEDYRELWERDIAWMKKLGINAVRIYAVDTSKDHDGFMCAMQEAGIYVLVGLSATCDGCSITMDPAPDCYSSSLKVRGMQVINHFSKYENVLGFDATNEVHLNSNVSDTGPCQRKFLSDMKTFISDCDAMPRKIPVGLSFADRDRTLIIDYYNCEEQRGDTGFPDWIGLNIYLDCNPDHLSANESKAFPVLLSDFENYSLPVLLTEFGCNGPQFPTIDGFEGQRNWRAAKWLHEGMYQEAFVGTFAFEFSTEAIWANRTGGYYPFQVYSDGDHGIGYYQPELCDHIDVPCEYVMKPQFDLLKEQYAATPNSGAFQRATFIPKSTARTVCPPGIEPVSNFVWPSDDEAGPYCWDQSVDPCGTKPGDDNGSVEAPTGTPSSGSPPTETSPTDPSPTGRPPSGSPTTGTSPSGNPSSGTTPSSTLPSDGGSADSSDGSRAMLAYASLAITMGLIQCSL